MPDRGDWKAAILLAARAGAIAPDAASELGDLVEAHGAGQPTPSQVARWAGIPEASVLALVSLARTLPPDATDAQVREAYVAHAQGLATAARLGDATPGTLSPTIGSTGVPGSEDSIWQRKTMPLTGSESAATIGGDAPPQILGRPNIPKKLGPYLLEEELGAGGMGIVFRARHEKLGTPCAVKVLVAGEHASAQSIARFQREAAAVAKMGKHPNIVGVFDLGQEGALAYYAMELIEGRTLRALLRERRPSAMEAASIAEKVARALHFAHEHGVIHRDIKPDNVLLRADDEPQVMDFGLARDVTSNAALSATGQLLGTPNYMAPEQIDGVPDAIDRRTDVYAIGAVLYEMIAGRQVHPGEAVVQVFARILTGELVLPHTIAKDVPRDLETVCLKALSLEPDRRYATAEALADDLARFQRGEPVLARPVGWVGRLWRKAKRNRAVAVLAVGLFLALLLSVGELGFFALLPRFLARSNAREEERLHATRRDDAAALLARAQAAEAAGRMDEAASAARELIRQFAAYTAKGEDLPVSEAHESLGRIARARDDARGALVEFFRAYESSVGSPRAAETLARIGHQLYAMDEMDRARGVFERALEERPGPRAEFQARLGLACCRMSAMRFEEARSDLEALRGRGGAMGEERTRIDRLLRVLDVLTPATKGKTGSFDLLFPCDLDRDGRPEIVSVDDDAHGVVLSTFDGRGFTETARVRVLGEETFPITTLGTGDLDGDGKDEVLAAGGDANRKTGMVAVIARRENALDLVAKAPLGSGLAKGCLATADLAGDGKRELLVGTGAYERGLRVYRLDAKARSLTLAGTLPLGGDALAVLPRDVNGNRRAEVWVVTGPWNGYHVDCLETDAKTGTFDVRSRTPLAGYSQVDPAAGIGGATDFLVGESWSATQIAPLQELYGRKGVEKTYRAPGLYRLRMNADLSAQVDPVWALGGLQESTGNWAVSFHGRETEYAWGTAPPPASGTCLYEKGKAGWAPLCLVHPPADFTVPIPWDLDGDGDSELLLGVPDPASGHARRVAILGLGSSRGTTAEAPTTAGATTSILPRRTSSPTLVAAREAMRVGLDAEALEGFAHVAANPPTAEDLEEASLGALACRARLGQAAEGASEARRLMAQYPMLRETLGRALLDAMERAGEWPAAAEVAEELLALPGLANDERLRLQARWARLVQLRSPALAFDGCSDAFGRCDLLATSPMWVTRAKDSSLVATPCSDSREGLFVPFAFDRSSYRLAVAVDVERLDWATGLDIGFVAGDPAASPLGDWRQSVAEAQFGRYPTVQSLRLSAAGESTAPLRTCDASWYAGGTSGSKRLLSSVPADGSTARMTLEYASHVRTLACEVGIGEGAPARARLEEAPLEEARLFLAIGAKGGSGSATFWARLRIRGLTVASGSQAMRPVPYEARRGADLLLLANGRWVQGRLDEARALYDRAVALSDLEAEQEKALRAQGLPAPGEGAWADAFLHWVAIDARYWRALLAAEAGDEEAARKGLEDAHGRSEERFRALVERNALGLLEHVKAADALRRHLLAKTGLDDSAKIGKVAEALLGPWGTDATDALLAGLGWRVARRPTVEEVRGEAADVRKGDVLVRYDGKEVPDYAAYRRLHGEVLDAEKEAIDLGLERDGKGVVVRIDPRKTLLVVQESLELRRSK